MAHTRKGSQPKSAKQTTLLQTWGYSGNESLASNAHGAANDSDLFPDDDEEMLSKALEASMAQFNREQEARPQPSTSGVATGSIPNDPSGFEELPPVPESTPLEQIPGFDNEAGKTWIYPTNYPVRKYQFDIVKTCLFQNTLVALPTGLGKTFIAAVVMYNFYRWYPQGRIVFMAPTKPLVAQQIEACFKIMGVPQRDMSEMTGNVAINVRKEAWKEKRIFFLTPQVMSNDLIRGLFPAGDVKLLVIDEAHRAQGDYAYCQVIRELNKSNAIYRVLALSATPGTDINAVRQVLQNLLISNIELRNEDSPDILPYTFQRSIEKVVVPLGDELKRVKMEFLSVMEPFVRRLAKFGVLLRRGNSIDPTHYTKFGLLQSRNEFRQNPPARLDFAQRGAVEGDFASAISLYHAYELLLQHGMRTFYNFVTKVTGEGEPVSGAGQTPTTGINRRLRYDLNRNATWQNLISELKSKFSEDSNHSRLNASGPKLWSQFTGMEATEAPTLVLGHPKLEKLRDLVVKHFREKEEQNVPTRVMIFSQYRDSVQEITACLHAFKPLIKVMEFVGQAGTKGKRGLTQKEQIEVVKRFREGGYNTIVSTCVGEEGLDIGEVDLIVCYDVSKSPIRLVQRMGRTGRKRAGKIIVLVTEGKEEQTYNQSMYSKNSVNKAIVEKHKLMAYLTPSPRMVPRGLEPVCHKMIMTVSNFVAAKSGRGGISSESHRKITSMLVKGSPKSGGQRGTIFRENFGFLSSEELKYWTENFCLTRDENQLLPKLKQRSENWFLNRDEIVTKMIKPDSGGQERTFDLSEWSLWQSTEQQRHFVSQSSNAKLYSDLNNFILMHKLQRGAQSGNQTYDEDDDFGYGAEMAAWLTDEDLPSPNPRPAPVKPKEVDDPMSPVLSRSFHNPVDNCNDYLNSGEFDDFQTPYFENLTQEKEDAVIESILGQGNFRTVEVPTPPEKIVTFPSPKSIESFDVLSLWTKLQNRSNVKENIPISPVISSSSQAVKPSVRSTFNLKTSTPLQPTSSRRERSLAKRSLCNNVAFSGENSSDFLKAIAEDSSFSAFTFEEEKKVSQPAETTQKTQLDQFSQRLNDKRCSNVIGESAQKNHGGNTSLFSATQLLGFLDKSSATADQSRSDSSDNSSSTKNVCTYSLDELPPLKYQVYKSRNIDERSGEFDLFVDFDFDGLQDEHCNEMGCVKARPESNPSEELKPIAEFKLPDLAEFESRTSKTPKKIHSQMSNVCGESQESPVVIIRKKSSSAALSSSSDDDSDRSRSADSPVVRPKKSLKRCHFIDAEAQLSEEDNENVSSDENDDEDTLNRYDESFVDDATQKVTDDQQAMYLRSVRSPTLKQFPARRPPRPMKREEIFSQFPTDSEIFDDFEQDSFVVGNSVVEYESSLDDLDMVDEFVSDDETPPRPKRGSKRSRPVSQSSDEEKTSKLVQKRKKIQKGRKRILTTESSNSEHEDNVVTPNSKLETNKESASVNNCITSPRVNVQRANLSTSTCSSNESSLDNSLSTKKTVLVAASEVHNSVELISELKHRYNIDVVVRNGLGVSFLLSPRLGLLKMSCKDFSNGSQKSRLVELCQKMNDLYDKPCLLVETDKPETSDNVRPFSGGFFEQHGGLHRTKYVDTIISQLSQSKFQVLYSGSQHESSSLLAALTNKEARKGFSLPYPLRLSEACEQVLPFYQSIPGVGFGTALVIAAQFKSPKDFVTAAQATISRKLCFDEKKSKAIREFCKRHFLGDMTAIGK